MLLKENQSVIRLGGSKSVKKHTRRDSELSATKNQMCAAEPLKQSSMNRQSQLRFYSKTDQGFFPKPSYVKQNQPVMASTMTTSFYQQPQRQVSPNMKIVKVMTARKQTEEECQLKRKVKILESRIQELHHQKQMEKISIGEQNRKLIEENNCLKKNLSECERVKKMEIEYLQRELETLQSIRKSELNGDPKKSMIEQVYESSLQARESKSESRLSMKNAIYVQDQKDIIQTIEDKNQCSRKNIAEKNDTQSKMQLLMDQLEASYRRNQELTRQLEQTKILIKQSSMIIEENNNKIIKEYDDKINMKQEELNRAILEIEQTKNYYTSIIKENNQSHEEQTHILQQKCRQLQAKIIELENQLVAMKTQKDDQIGHLTSQNMNLKQSLQSQLTKQPESCQKCKQLIKNLMRLNQKSMIKAK